MGGLFKDTPSAPPAPNYQGAAQTQGYNNVQTAILNNILSHQNQTTPYGTLAWNQTGTADVPQIGDQPGFSIPTYTSSINFNPTGQQLQDYQNQAALGLGGLFNTSLGRVDQNVSQPLDTATLGQLQDKAYQTMTSRLDPQWNERAAQQDTALRNQGLTPGTQAYDAAMRDFNQGRNDAYSQANLSALNYAPQLLQQELAIRNQPLTELNSLRTGAQPTLPSFQQSPQGTAQSAPLYNAAVQQGQYNQGQYNAQLANQAQTTGGLFDVAGSLFGGSSKPWWMVAA